MGDGGGRDMSSAPPASEGRSEGRSAAKKPAGKFEDMDDDIPF